MTDAPNSKPDRDTLLLWMSAHLDGELAETEQEILFQSMESDPELLVEFEELANFASIPETAAAFAHPPTASGYGPGDQVDFQSALTDSVMFAVEPSAVSDTANGAAHLACLYIDGQLDRANSQLEQTMKRSDAAASAVFALATTSEAVSVTLDSTAETAFVKDAVAGLARQVELGIAQDERAAILFSGALDGELNTKEQDELATLQAASAGPFSLEVAASDFVHASEAAGAVLRASAEDPMAKRAGEAALKAIAAYEANARASEKAAPKAPAVSFGERLRGWFKPAIPLVAGAAAVFAFMVLPQGEAPVEPVDKPVVIDFAKLLPEVDPTDANIDNLELLDDNTAEVQAIDSGSQVAAVFSTEAHGVTVIWVPEPEESGT